MAVISLTNKGYGATPRISAWTHWNFTVPDVNYGSNGKWANWVASGY